MRTDPHLERLLDDLLRDSTDRRSIDRMLRAVKIRRCFQHAAVVSMLLLFALCVTTWRRTVAVREQARAPEPGIMVTMSQPLLSSMIVESRPEGFGVIASSADSVVMIDTQPAQNLFRQISEQELLALVHGHAAGLVWSSGPRNPNFLLLDPADENGFPALVH